MGCLVRQEASMWHTSSSQIGKAPPPADLYKRQLLFRRPSHTAHSQASSTLEQRLPMLLVCRRSVGRHPTGSRSPSPNTELIIYLILLNAHRKFNTFECSNVMLKLRCDKLSTKLRCVIQFLINLYKHKLK